MKILLLSRYEASGASSRFRCYQFIPYLEQNGHTVTVAPLLSNAYVAALNSGKRFSVTDIVARYMKRMRTLFADGNYDLIWVQQEFFPWLPAWLEDVLRGNRTPFVVDYDDAFFHRYDTHASSVVRNVLGKKIDRVMRAAATVVAGNEYIAERAASAGASRIEILPTVVDDSVYTPVQRTPSGSFTIGWIGSAPTATYVRDIAEALGTLANDGGSRVVLVGAGSAVDPGFPAEHHPWVLGQEPKEIAGFDVGVMPLRDTPWERGKCGFKLIQYMATGLPVVASPVGINAQIVDPGTDGFLASTNEEWIRALRTLRDDPALRDSMGAKGRVKVETRYSLRKIAPVLLQTLLHAAGKST
jgi:glycosyltransferase involved in cell wall biosynthesis